MRLRVQKPGEVYREPFKHQVRALQRASVLDCPAFLMEMRTGKTLTCIRWVKSLPREEARTVIVICPATVVLVWKRELTMEGEDYVIPRGSEVSKYASIMQAFKSKTRRWVLLSYEKLVDMAPVKEVKVRGKIRRLREVPLVANLPWDVVVLDESREICNPNSQASRICTEGFENSNRRTILTGMIRTESDLEVFPQMKFLHGHFMGYREYHRFKNAMFERDYDGNLKHKRGCKALIKKAVHERAVVCSAAQAGMPTLPFYEPRYLKMSRRQRSLYNRAEKEFAMLLQHPELQENPPNGRKHEEGWILETTYTLTMRTWLRYLTGGFDPAKKLVCRAKADELVRILTSDLADKQVAVWFAMRHELRYIEERLSEAGITHSSIVGGMGLRHKEEALDKAHRGDARVFLATEDTVQYGVDCSFSDTGIYYSNSWSGQSRGKSERRIFHPDKPGPRLIIDLLAEDSWECDQYDTLREKVRQSRDFMREIDRRFLQRVIEMARRGNGNRSHST